MFTKEEPCLSAITFIVPITHIDRICTRLENYLNSEVFFNLIEVQLIYRASQVAHMVKLSACNEGDQGSIPGLGRYPGAENGDPFQYSHLENLMDRGAWQATVHGVIKELNTA